MNNTSISDTEIVFGRSDSPSETLVSAFPDGQVTVTVQNTEVPGHACDNELTLAQAIQLRDFLNRHIDGLALAATGSLAMRAADGSGQLAAEELLQAGLDAIAPKPLPTAPRLPDLVPSALADAPTGVLHLVWDSGKNECVGFYESEDADFAETGNHGLVRNGLADAFRDRVCAFTGDRLPRTTVTFY